LESVTVTVPVGSTFVEASNMTVKPLPLDEVVTDSVVLILKTALAAPTVSVLEALTV
jgi:hypothetical protein